MIIIVALITAEASDSISVFDAHNQYDFGLTADEIIALMDKAGVQRTFLASRDVEGGDSFVLRAATKYPNRIFPLIRTKGNKDFESSNAALKSHLAVAGKDQRYFGLAELLLFHNEKWYGAKLRSILPDDEKVAIAIEAAEKKILF